MITSSDLSKAFSYKEYRKMIDDLLAQNKTTGNDQSEAMISYAKINQQRMQRLEKTVVINDELKQALLELKKKVVLVVLTEGWCGDAAQNLPVLSFMQELSQNIDLKLLLRDENIELTDRYSTNGARSIPKVICIEKESGKELFVWGPRPKPCQQLALELKAKNVSAKEKGEAIHLWYARDKTQTLQSEFSELLKKI